MKKASHATLEFKTQEQQIQTEWDNLVNKQPFIISGFDISGQVNSGGEGAGEIDFLLFSSDVKSIKCQKPNIAGLKKKKKNKREKREKREKNSIVFCLK